MMALYTATSLAGLAEAFERIARDKDTRRAGVKTQREGHVLLAEARAWREAAEILRNVELRPIPAPAGLGADPVPAMPMMEK